MNRSYLLILPLLLAALPLSIGVCQVNSNENNALVFTVNNTEYMRISGTAGNVGIGTSAPSTALDVNGVVSATILRAFSAVSGDEILRYETINYPLIQQVSDRGAIKIASQDDSLYIGNGDVARTISETFFNPVNENIGIASDGSIYLFPGLQNGWGTSSPSIFTANGRLGIGDLAPLAQLEVSGTISATSAIQIGTSALSCTAGIPGAIRYNAGTLEYCNSSAWTPLTTGGGSLSGSGAANHVAYWTGTSTIAHDPDQLYWNAASNRLGISTNAPAVPLEVSGSGDTIRLSKIGATTNPYVSWYNDAVRQAYIGYGTKNADFDITTENGTRLDITGNAGIALTTATGEITANDRLAIAAHARLSGATSNSIAWGTAGTGAPGAGSNGLKLSLYGSGLNVMGATDFALGIESGNLWLNTGGGIKLYSGSTLRAEMASAGTISATAFHASNGDTAAAPGHTWIGDTNTGMFHPVADVIGISINGTERARVFSTGVSTTGVYYAGNGSAATPAFNFASDLNTGFYRAYGDAIGTSINGTDRFRITSAGVSVTGYVSVSGIVDIGTQALGNSGDTAAAPSYSWTGDTNVGIFRPTTDAIGLTTAGAERVRVTAAGDVGIGTSTPAGKLDVSGNDNNGTTAALIVRSGAQTMLLDGNEIDSPDVLYLQNNTSAALALSLGGGSVGIGLAAPLDKLHLDGDNTYVRIDGGNGYMGVKLTDDGVLKWQLYNSSGTSDRFYIVDKDSNNGLYIAQDATAWTANSDRRLKKNIKEYSVLDRIDGFRAVTFDWKSDGKRDFGVIAQEVYKTFPEVVDKGNDDLDKDIADTQDPAVWGVRYDRIGVLALEGVKEMNAKLKAENDNLRAASDALEARLWALEQKLMTH